MRNHPALRKGLAWLAAIGLLPPAVLLASPQERAVAPAPTPAEADAARETWSVLKVDGQDAGYAHETSRPIRGEDGAALYETTVDTLFAMRRLGTEVRVRTRSTTVEDARGQIVRMHERQEMAGVPTIFEGVVADGELHVTVTSTGPARASTIPWADDVPGPRELERRLRATGLAAGAEVRTQTFQFTFGDVLPMRIEVGAEEEVDVGGRKLRLVRATHRIGALPPTAAWVDQDARTLRTKTSLAGLTIETEATERERVREFAEGGGRGAEAFAPSMILSNVRLPRPRSLDAVRYAVRATDGEPLPALGDDARQRLSGADAEGWAVLEVVLRVPRTTRTQRLPIADPPAELLEFLEPNALLQSDDPAIQALAQEAVGEEEDPWRAAQALEKTVHEVVSSKSLDVAFASAAEVLATKEGDCSEHAVLLAALCRAAGIPSRVAMGLVYVGGVFGGHAWTEVFVDGEWYGLDGTIGAGSVDPTHLRLGVTSLKGGGMGEAMIGAAQGLGRLELRIVGFREAGREVEAAAIDEPLAVVDGKVVDRVEGASFRLPAGFRLAGERLDVLRMENSFELARLAPASGDGGGELSVEVVHLGDERSPERILDGRAERTVETAAGAWSLRDAGDATVAVLVRDDTAYRVEGPASPVMAVVESFRLE